jgi:thiol-disulfide isomerase/thioredoxin
VEDYLKLVKDLEALPPGSAAPAITGTTPDGKKISLTDFRGKLVLVDFWASWCGPCRRANPDLRRLYEKYRSDRFDLLGVSLDEDAASWKQAIEKDGLVWPQLSELRKWDSKCVQDYRIEAIPFSVLVDEAGKIIAKGLSAEELDREIRAALNKK